MWWFLGKFCSYIERLSSANSKRIYVHKQRTKQILISSECVRNNHIYRCIYIYIQSVCSHEIWSRKQVWFLQMAVLGVQEKLDCLRQQGVDRVDHWTTIFNFDDDGDDSRFENLFSDKVLGPFLGLFLWRCTLERMKGCNKQVKTAGVWMNPSTELLFGTPVSVKS